MSLYMIYLVMIPLGVIGTDHVSNTDVELI